MTGGPNVTLGQIDVMGSQPAAAAAPQASSGIGSFVPYLLVGAAALLGWYLWKQHSGGGGTTHLIPPAWGRHAKNSLVYLGVFAGGYAVGKYM